MGNTTMGVVLASVDINILIIALPAIFRGINLDPLSPGAFDYLLWIVFGYNVVTATLLVTFGRLSDMLGRVRIYNLGFAVYTVGSILLYLVPNRGQLGALEILVFRLVQGVGGALIFSNSAALITDAFPSSERGRALGINQVAILVGSLLGLILGGVLAVYDWRWVFLISVPFGVCGTVWSYWKLHELAVIKTSQKVDVWGNVTFAVGLTVFLIGMTYGLLPFGDSSMGWSNPLVIGCLALGGIMLILFPFIERRVQDPMFRIEFFKNRAFSSGSLAAFLSALSRGGVLLMLVILLQAIWLPLHGFSYQDTPFWAGIYMVPMSLGFVSAGPVSGWMSDKWGARGLASGGMFLLCAIFLTLSALPYNFAYQTFAVALFIMGVAFGMFAAPNTSSIMGTVPPERRSSAAGMLYTIQNTGTTLGLTVLFTEVVAALGVSLPRALSTALANAGAPQLGPYLSSIPPTIALFAAFLGYNPMQEMITRLPALAGAHVTTQALSTITSPTWFPNAIAQSFMGSLHFALYLDAGLAIVAAIASLMRGKNQEFENNANIRRLQTPIAMSQDLTNGGRGSRSGDSDNAPNSSKQTRNQVLQAQMRTDREGDH